MGVHLDLYPSSQGRNGSSHDTTPELMCAYHVCLLCSPVESWQCHPCSAAGTLEQTAVKELTRQRGVVELGPETRQIQGRCGFPWSCFLHIWSHADTRAIPFTHLFICFSSRFLNEVWFVVPFMAIDTKISGIGENVVHTCEGFALFTFKFTFAARDLA